jgi:hypothetical protein
MSKKLVVDVFFIYKLSIDNAKNSEKGFFLRKKGLQILGEFDLLPKSC